MDIFFNGPFSGTKNVDDIFEKMCLIVALQAGLVDEWKWRTWTKKKSLAKKDKLVDYKEKPTISALSMDDVQSAFVLYGLFTAVCLVTLLGEILGTKAGHKS